MQLSITRSVYGQTPIYTAQQNVPLIQSQVYITGLCWHCCVSLWLWRAVIPHRQSSAGRSSCCERSPGWQGHLQVVLQVLHWSVP